MKSGSIQRLSKVSESESKMRLSDVQNEEKVSTPSAGKSLCLCASVVKRILLNGSLISRKCKERE